MKRITALLLLTIFIIGCKGQRGDQGEDGQRGPQGLTGLPGVPGAPGTAGTITTYTGPITSDSQTISIPDYSTILKSGILVYIWVGGQYLQLPIWNPTKSINVIFGASSGWVLISNAASGSGTSYQIVVINT